MAALLPPIYSDNEDNDINNESDEEEDGDDEVNHDFSFGGILGEDGGGGSALMPGQEGWSYQTALDKLEKSNGVSTAPPRMDVSSLIIAKRKSLKAGGKIKEIASLIDAKRQSLNLDGKTQVNDQDKIELNSGSESENENDSASESVKHSGGEEQEGHEDGSNGNSSDDDDDESGSDSSEDEADDQVDDADKDMEDDVLKTRMGRDDDDDEEEDDDDDQEDVADNRGGRQTDDEEEAKKAADFFENQNETQDQVEVFAQLTLSRPLLRGIASMGYVKPTAIQSSVIPVVLAGRDICASAVTGSGKTAAFLLPILEKLLYRSPGRIKALVLTPTRELAAQCIGMMASLAQFTKLSSALIVGGSKNIKSQMAELRARPSLVVATPGRLLDHVTNSTGVSLEDVEFLVLDEADRLLDLGFQDEVTEIIKACPIERQTLLFSATMNTKVDDLIKLSMKRPVRVRISDKEDNSSGGKDLEVAPRLEQEFVRVRSGNEGVNREGMLLALLTRTFSTQTIVFFDTKAKAHRMMILCGLCGIKCAELHGNLTQTQRLEALEQFRKGEVDVLLATDLAARGLDISRVETVINFEMPNQVETYIHRIGRTARAGRGGRSCTLIGEGRRHLMKQIMKDAADKNKSEKKVQTAVIRSRSIPSAVISHFVAKIESLEEHVEEVRQAETVAKMDRLAEMEANKAQNIIEHSDEIKNRPKREWFASESQKKKTKEAATEKARLIAEKVGNGTHRMTRKKRRAREAKTMFEDNGNDDEVGDGGEKPSRQLPSIKKLAREHKREAEEKVREKYTKSVHDEDMERAKKKRKGVSGSDALGDSRLFSEEQVAYAPKKKATDVDVPAKSSYHFRDSDPKADGKKKGKKKSHHKFKSKSKHKRK